MSSFDLPSRSINKPPYPAVDGTGVRQPRRKPVEPSGGDDLVQAPLAPRKPSPPTTIASADEVYLPVPSRKPAVPTGGAGTGAGTGSVAATGATTRPTMADFTESAHQAARIANVSFADVLAKAAQESNFNPNCHSNQSSAVGPFQFVEQTWLDMVRRHGAAYGLGAEASQIHMHNGVASVSDPALRKRLLDLRKDVNLSSGMAARYLDESTHDLGRVLKRTPTETESRVAYFLGPGGAAKLIRAAQHNPGGLASSVLPQAAAANHPLFYGSQGALTNREAMTRITHFVNRHLEEYSALGKEAPTVTTDQMVGDPNAG